MMVRVITYTSMVLGASFPACAIVGAAAILPSLAIAQLGADRQAASGWSHYVPAAKAPAITAIEASLNDERWGDQPRVERLARLTYSLRTFGRFEEALAACELFLTEFGPKHPYAGDVAMRRAESLAPMSLDSYTIQQTERGPVFAANWSLGRRPTDDQLRAAERAYRFAAEIAADENLKISALFMRGWIYRCLGDWRASTDAWMECAQSVPQSLKARQALWLAAENLELLSDLPKAARIFDQFAQEFPQDDAAPQARRKAASLWAASRRTDESLANPVTTYRREVEAEPRGARSTFEIYADLIAWLKARNATTAALTLSRWVKDRPGWTDEQTVRIWLDVADQLLVAGDDVSRDVLIEAADAVHQAAASLRKEDPRRVQLGLREVQLYRRLADHEGALCLLDQIRSSESLAQFRERFQAEEIRVLVASGRTREAQGKLAEFRTSYPASHEITVLAQFINSPQGKE